MKFQFQSAKHPRERGRKVQDFHQGQDQHKAEFGPVDQESHLPGSRATIYPTSELRNDHSVEERVPGKTYF